MQSAPLHAYALVGSSERRSGELFDRHATGKLRHIMKSGKAAFCNAGGVVLMWKSISPSVRARTNSCATASRE
jgi:hypothetical protein